MRRSENSRNALNFAPWRVVHRKWRRVNPMEKYEKLWHSRREHLVASQRDTLRLRLPARLGLSPIRLIFVPQCAYFCVYKRAGVWARTYRLARYYRPSPYECPLRNSEDLYCSPMVVWIVYGGCEEGKRRTQWTDSWASRGKLSTFVASIFACRYFLQKKNWEREKKGETKNVTVYSWARSSLVRETRPPWLWKPGKPTWKKTGDLIAEVQIAASFVCGTNEPYKSGRAHAACYLQLLVR